MTADMFWARLREAIIDTGEHMKHPTWPVLARDVVKALQRDGNVQEFIWRANQRRPARKRRRRGKGKA